MLFWLVALAPSRKITYVVNLEHRRRRTDDQRARFGGRGFRHGRTIGSLFKVP